jgi:hypothetical protein
MKHHFTKKIDLIIHGYDDDRDDNDEHDDTENVNEMEDINAMRLKAVTLNIVNKKTLQLQIILKIMPDILNYGTMLLAFCRLCKKNYNVN